MNKENQTTSTINENAPAPIQEEAVILETPERRMYKDFMSKIEHTNLSPAASLQDVQTLCQDAVNYNFHSICVHPVYVKNAYKFLKKSGNLLDVQIATVVGYPFGENLLKTKLYEVKQIFKSKADIVDVYLNISAIKHQNHKDKAIKKQVKKFAKFTKIVKDTQRDKKKDKIARLVLDTRYLTLPEIQTICNYCVDYKVQYVTITEGITSTKLNFEEIQNLVVSLAGRLSIKLNYNIKTLAELKALKYIDRFSTKFGPEIAEELQQELDLNSL